MTVIIINRHACPLIAAFSNHRQTLEIDTSGKSCPKPGVVFPLYNPIFETCYLKWFDPQRVSKTSNYFGTSYFLSPPLWIVGSMTLNSGSLGFPGLGKLHGAERHPCLRCMWRLDHEDVNCFQKKWESTVIITNWYALHTQNSKQHWWRFRPRKES